MDAFDNAFAVAIAMISESKMAIRRTPTVSGGGFTVEFVDGDSVAVSLVVDLVIVGRKLAGRVQVQPAPQYLTPGTAKRVFELGLTVSALATTIQRVFDDCVDTTLVSWAAKEK